MWIGIPSFIPGIYEGVYYYTVDVYNILGQLVFTAVRISQNYGGLPTTCVVHHNDEILLWEGKDNGGNEVEPGFYEVKVTAHIPHFGWEIHVNKRVTIVH